MTDLMEEDPSSGMQSSEEEQAEVQIESLVQGRAKRSTAGQHMSALIDAAADDDLALLFEEVEDDNEFAMEENAEEEDMGIESSSDDDDDQGPNTQNDYEGEKQLQKDERKKRRAQNDLRFQTLRKRVKIDPTAVSAIPAPPRPKKKSERISWLPTVEDGPTRSSSRRQTMVNKEMTHARLKDSQEKRVRIIATMKEAEKRKAHLKPREMTQEDHLAEAERIERTNSKSLNRWEQAERRKADERRAKIEALQNRRLDGPVMSYWSGLATWVNGRLTKVGKAEIKSKPEKEVVKKKKAEKDVKPANAQETPKDAMAALTDSSAAPAPTGPSATPAATQSINPPTQPEAAQDPASTTAPTTAPTTASDAQNPVPMDQQPPNDTPSQPTPAPETTATPAPADQPAKPDEKAEETSPGQQKSADTTNVDGEKVQETAGEKTEPEPEPESTANTTPSEAPRRSSQGYPLPTVEIINRRESATATQASGDEPPKPVAENAENADPMDLDKEVEPTIKADEPTTTNTNPPSKSTDTAVSADTVQTDSEVPVSSSEQVTQATSATSATPLAPQVPPVPSADAPPLSTAPPENTTEGQPISGPSPAVDETPAQPEIPQPPPVIEHTGRNLTILENFDDRTAHSKKYSIYFNARKPPRLAKISSSLCVITSLPSRYRDPETSLPYANSYAYGQIRRLQAQGYIWSGMLGCFVGPAETAARGVPARFLGGEKSAEEILKEKEDKEKEQKERERIEKEKEAKKQETPKGPDKAEPKNDAVTTSAEPMEVDAA